MKLVIKPLISLLLAFSASSFASQNVSNESFKDWQSPEKIIEAMYSTISAGPGVERDWDRFRALFFENAQMLISMQTPQFSGILAANIETLITQTDSAYGKTGFHENEISQKVLLYGNMASVYSSFEVKFRKTDEKPFMKGLNHFQLLFDGDRWWIISNTSVLDNKELAVSEAIE